MIPFTDQCIYCIHYQGQKEIRAEYFRFTCEAFPKGIPDEIFIDGKDHTKAWPGDHGIRFEEKTS